MMTVFGKKKLGDEDSRVEVDCYVEFFKNFTDVSMKMLKKLSRPK